LAQRRLARARPRSCGKDGGRSWGEEALVQRIT
jgi:hypothetical protein